MRTKIYTAPGGTTTNFFKELLSQSHLLVAGTTGSGKSVIINGLITTILQSDIPTTRFILIDPKRVELCEYKRLPHTEIYASEPQTMLCALERAVEIMESRYQDMQLKGIRSYDGSPLWVFVDEYADLVITMRKQVEPLIIRLAQLGRAAKIHLIIATQRPTSDIINGTIKVNIDSRVALRVPTAQDSRNIVNTSGAECLPKYGECLYTSPDLLTTEHRRVALLPHGEHERVMDYWRQHRPINLRKAKRLGLIA